MKIAFDESGAYGLGRERFEPYVLTGLIVPDSRLDAVQRFAEDVRSRWQRTELKSSRLRPSWVFETADFLASHQVSAVVYVTDNEMMTRQVVRGFRLRQAAEIAKGRRHIVERDPQDARLPEIDALLDQIAGVPTTQPMSDDDFIQSQQMPELILDCVQRACSRYREDGWDQDFRHFQFVVDGKQPDRLKAGERYVHENLERMLGSTRRLSLELPFEWRQRPDHPFRRFDDPDGEHTLLSDLLAARNWVRSLDDDCVQLADVVAGIVRSVVERGAGSRRWPAYEVLRNVVTDEHGCCLRLFRFRDAPYPDLARYGPLLRAWPIEKRLQRVTPSGAVLLGRPGRAETLAV